MRICPELKDAHQHSHWFRSSLAQGMQQLSISWIQPCVVALGVVWCGVAWISSIFLNGLYFTILSWLMLSLLPVCLSATFFLPSNFPGMCSVSRPTLAGCQWPSRGQLSSHQSSRSTRLGDHSKAQETKERIFWINCRVTPHVPSIGPLLRHWILTFHYQQILIIKIKEIKAWNISQPIQTRLKWLWFPLHIDSSQHNHSPVHPRPTSHWIILKLFWM